MTGHSKTQPIKRTKRSLKHRLMVMSLGLALVPLILVSASIFISARNNQRQTAFQILSSASQSSISFLENWFDYRFIDLDIQSSNRDNALFMNELSSTFEASQLSLTQFVRSDDWNKLVNENGSDLANFVRLYNYYDLLLIDPDGNILFTAAQEKDLGTNLFEGPLGQTHFAESCRKALRTQQPTFSDIAKYAPSHEQVFGFLSSVITNNNDEVIGMVTLQITAERIYTALENNSLKHAGGYIYLVGPSPSGDKVTLRTPWRMTQSDNNKEMVNNFIGGFINTQQTEKWQQRSTDQVPDLSSLQENSEYTYIGPAGDKVMGIHHNLSIADVQWGLIVEIPTSKAFARTIHMQQWVSLLVLAVGLLVSLLAHLMTRKLVHPIVRLSEVAKLVSRGDLNQKIESKDPTEVGELTQSFNSMVDNLRQNQFKQDHQLWLESGQSNLLFKMRGDFEIITLGNIIISFLAEILNAQVGTLYIADDYSNLKLSGSYAFQNNEIASEIFVAGEGLIGQAALAKEPIKLTNVPDGYLTISSGLGETTPRHILIWPILRNDETKGVIELGSLDPFPDSALELLNAVSEGIAVALYSTQANLDLQILLENSQAQAEELQAQTEMLTERESELQETNSSLALKTEGLQASEELLQQQSEELQATNEQLEEKSQTLEQQKRKLQKANLAIEANASELAKASQYKSDFLANMSHELRTPLNSLLILSKSLADNTTGNLTEEQVKAAEVIHNGGGDLLKLINNILDLSKIEAGKQDICLAPMRFDSLRERLTTMFNQFAKEKDIKLTIEQSFHLPELMTTDGQKVEQILRNLLSNAFKFTQEGFIKLNIDLAPEEPGLKKTNSTAVPIIAFSVQDSGIGIPVEKQKAIFESFQQADGSTSRNFGGTGLGLTISRQFSRLLGGRIAVQSTPDQGSTFTLLLPLEPVDGHCLEQSSLEQSSLEQSGLEQSNPKPVTNASFEGTAPIETSVFLTDDRHALSTNGRCILIVEDDRNFAKILVGLCHQKGFQCLVTPRGSEALHLISKYHPDAVILDLSLADLNGLAVLEEIKTNLNQRHIPVHIISAQDRKTASLKMGAIGYLKKPTSTKDILNALATIEDQIETANSTNLLTDKASLFIHSIESNLPEPKKQGLISVHNKDDRLKNKRILVVDDEQRNTFAMANVLESAGINVCFADNGQACLEVLEKDREFDLILMDIMMPVMDGYEASQKIREDKNLCHIPIIALTAKAMPEDRARCIAAGANDYLTKPVNTDHLLSLIRVWTFNMECVT